MQRAFELDVSSCPKCSGRMRVLALVDNLKGARRILRHLGMRHPPPESRPPAPLTAPSITSRSFRATQRSSRCAQRPARSANQRLQRTQTEPP